MRAASCRGGGGLPAAGGAFWGELHGQLADPFGHRWNVSQHLRDVPHDEVVAASARVFRLSCALPGPGHERAVAAVPRRDVLRVALKQRRHGYATAVLRAFARTTEDVVIDLDQPIVATRRLLRRRPRLH